MYSQFVKKMYYIFMNMILQSRFSWKKQIHPDFLYLDKVLKKSIIGFYPLKNKSTAKM